MIPAQPPPPLMAGPLAVVDRIARMEATPRDVVAAETGVWLLSQRVKVTPPGQGPGSGPTITQTGARLTRIDPATGGELSRIDLPTSPEQLVQGRTGRLWVTGSTLTVVDPRTGVVSTSPRPSCVTLVADASPGIWAYEPCSRRLRRLTPTGRAAGASQPLRGADVTALALGRDGLYLSRRDGRRTVLERRDPIDGRLIRRVRGGTPPNGLVLRGGSIWALRWSRGVLDRLDPLTLRRTARIPLGVRAVGAARLAVGGGAAWITDPTDLRIIRIDPRTERARSRRLSGLPPGTTPTAIATGRHATWLVALSDGTRGALCRFSPRAGRVERCFPRSD